MRKLKTLSEIGREMGKEEKMDLMEDVRREMEKARIYSDDFRTFSNKDDVVVKRTRTFSTTEEFPKKKGIFSDRKSVSTCRCNRSQSASFVQEKKKTVLKEKSLKRNGETFRSREVTKSRTTVKNCRPEDTWHETLCGNSTGKSLLDKQTWEESVGLDSNEHLEGIVITPYRPRSFGGETWKELSGGREKVPVVSSQPVLCAKKCLPKVVKVDTKRSKSLHLKMTDNSGGSSSLGTSSGRKCPKIEEKKRKICLKSTEKSPRDSKSPIRSSKPRFRTQFPTSSTHRQKEIPKNMQSSTANEKFRIKRQHFSAPTSPTRLKSFNKQEKDEIHAHACDSELFLTGVESFDEKSMYSPISSESERFDPNKKPKQKIGRDSLRENCKPTSNYDKLRIRSEFAPPRACPAYPLPTEVDFSVSKSSFTENSVNLDSCSPPTSDRERYSKSFGTEEFGMPLRGSLATNSEPERSFKSIPDRIEECEREKLRKECVRRTFGKIEERLRLLKTEQEDPMCPESVETKEECTQMSFNEFQPPEILPKCQYFEPMTACNSKSTGESLISTKSTIERPESPQNCFNPCAVTQHYLESPENIKDLSETPEKCIKSIEESRKCTQIPIKITKSPPNSVESERRPINQSNPADLIQESAQNALSSSRSEKESKKSMKSPSICSKSPKKCSNTSSDIKNRKESIQSTSNRSKSSYEKKNKCKSAKIKQENEPYESLQHLMDKFGRGKDAETSSKALQSVEYAKLETKKSVFTPKKELPSISSSEVVDLVEEMPEIAQTAILVEEPASEKLLSTPVVKEETEKLSSLLPAAPKTFRLATIPTKTQKYPPFTGCECMRPIYNRVVGLLEEKTPPADCLVEFSCENLICESKSGQHLLLSVCRG